MNDKMSRDFSLSIASQYIRNNYERNINIHQESKNKNSHKSKNKTPHESNIKNPRESYNKNPHEVASTTSKKTESRIQRHLLHIDILLGVIDFGSRWVEDK